MSHPIALITGATSGIGHATALNLAVHGYDLILMARRADRLDEIAKNIKKKYKRESFLIVADVRDKKIVAEKISALPKRWQNINVLVNNAGLALERVPIQDGNIDDWDTMIDTNLKGLLYVTHAVLPFLKRRPGNQIINLGSIAGKEVYPAGNVYVATKHAVVALSQAMRMDLLPLGIKVTAINPGHVETEFATVRYKGDQSKAKAAYQGFTPLRPEDIAEAIYFAVSRPPNVTINDLVIMSTAQAASGVILKK